MESFSEVEINQILSDVLLSLEAKDKIIRSQEKDISSLKREISQLKKEMDCFQSEKEQ